MNLDKRNQLEQEYLEGKTSLAEEKQLFREQAANGRFKAWAQFREDMYAAQPKDLLTTIGKELDARQPKNRQLLIRLLAVAASIALLVVFFHNRTSQNAMTYNEKAAILEEVLQILPKEANNSEYILYEDALLVIYVETK